jgi:integrase
MTAEPQRRRRRVLTDAMIANLPRRAKRYPYSDPQQVGLFIRVMPTAAHVFIVCGRDPYGKQTWVTLGTTDELKVEEAREQARAIRKRLKQGLPAVEPPPPKAESFASVAENWLKRHVHENGVRTAAAMERILAKYVLPYWGQRDLISIKRRDITGLLDSIQDKHGRHMADKVAMVLRNIGKWHGDRVDDYVSPFAGLKSRVPKHLQKRSRTLVDDELRSIWNAADAAGPLGAAVKLLILTGQRREKIWTLAWSDISPEGVWTIPREDREKPNAGELRLPEQALNIIRSQPRFVGSPFVFATRGAFNSRAVAAFREASGTQGWRLHDLRRSARTLLSCAGVQPHVAERCLGHAVGTIEATYDRHTFDLEKADALRRLAAAVDYIVGGGSTSPDDIAALRAHIEKVITAPDNVVRLRFAAADVS